MIKTLVNRRSPLLIIIALCCVISSPFSVYALEPADYSGQDVYFYSKLAACAESSSSLVGNSNLEKIYNYLLGKGLKDYQAAGAVGNISQESGGNPVNAQKGPDTKDPSTLTGPIGGGNAWGIVQWDSGSRAVGYAKQAKVTAPIYELSAQLDIVWWHMTVETPTSKRKFIDEYKKSTDIESATTSFEHGMEGAGKPNMTDRISAARGALKAYGSGTTNAVASDGTTPADTTTPNSDCSSSNVPGSQNGKTILGIAQAELAKGVREWDSNALKYTDGHKWAWCASFVSWVYKESGTPFTGGISGGWLIPGVDNMKAWFQKHGTYFNVGAGEPQPGDVAIYQNSYSHVNIVEKYANGMMTTIGGNQSNQVTRYPTWKVSTHPMGLVGFGRMK